MSLNASRWAWTLKMKGGPKLVLLALADYADNQGHCFASTKNLAAKCGLARSTICQYLRWLRNSNFITATRQISQQGYRRANHYQLLLSSYFVRLSPTHGRGDVREPDRNNINNPKNYHKNVRCPSGGLRFSSGKKGEKEALRGAL